MTVPFSEIGTYIASLLLIGGYHLYLRIRLRRNRAYTIQSINYNARVAWVENIMSDKSRGILAVQTLRNSTMAATFLASTAILMSMGVLNLMQKGDADNSLLHALHNSLITGGEFEDIKLLILLGTFFLAFFSFSMAVRMYNHVGYLINSSNDKLRFKPSTSYVSKLLNRSGDYYSFGMRAYYVSVPMMFSLFNPYYMIVASIVLVVFLYFIDRAPKEEVRISQNGSEDKHQTESSLFLFRNRKPAEATVLPNSKNSQADLSNEEIRIKDNSVVANPG